MLPVVFAWKPRTVPGAMIVSRGAIRITGNGFTTAVSALDDTGKIEQALPTLVTVQVITSPLDS